MTSYLENYIFIYVETSTKQILIVDYYYFKTYMYRLLYMYIMIQTV